jgi:hypothetical protein
MRMTLLTALGGAFGASIVLLSACASRQTPAGGGQSEKLTIATGVASGSTKLALLTGTLEGSRSGTTACFWVKVAGGRRPIVWPHGWTAEAEPLRLLDAGHRGVAHVGDRIALTGGDLDATTSVKYCQGLTGSFATSGLAK